MKNVLYRELLKNDYERIKELICQAFGFNDFIKDKKLLDLILNAYLQGCILDSSFSRVAVKDNKVIGIILGDAKDATNDKKHLRKMHNYLSLFFTGMKLILSSKEDKKLLKEFSKIKDTYKEIIFGLEDNFQGCIQLFIVAPESQGLGVGKTLVSSLFDYMKSMDVNSLYLYTDSRCNYRFYDSQNFKRINEKQICFKSVKDKLDVFLYSYEFE